VSVGKGKRGTLSFTWSVKKEYVFRLFEKKIFLLKCFRAKSNATERFCNPLEKMPANANVSDGIIKDC
jgi:hypothetical protein